MELRRHELGCGWTGYIRHYARHTKLEMHLIDTIIPWAKLEDELNFEKIEKKVRSEISSCGFSGQVYVVKRCAGTVLKSPPVDFYEIMIGTMKRRGIITISEPIP